MTWSAEKEARRLTDEQADATCDHLRRPGLLCGHCEEAIAASALQRAFDAGVEQERLLTEAAKVKTEWALDRVEEYRREVERREEMLSGPEERAEWQQHSTVLMRRVERLEKALREVVEAACDEFGPDFPDERDGRHGASIAAARAALRGKG